MNTWTTKDGRVLLISEMEDSHLLNAIHLMERVWAAYVLQYVAGPQPSGDLAQEAFDMEFDRLSEGGPGIVNEKYGLLVQESDRRMIDGPEARRARLMLLDAWIAAKVIRGAK
jgi:hypothetical protein